MERLGLGLIGCGAIARSAHLPAMATLADRVELRAAADIDAQAAAAAAASWGAEATTDWRAVLDRADIQAVVIATPESCHLEQVTAAAASGKHLLCEKPLSRTLAEADAMIVACARAGVRFLVGHSRRYTRRYQQIRAALDRGDIGALRMLRENERRPRALDQVWWTPRHWTGNPAVSGGAPLMNAIHEADLLRWFTGAAPREVRAEAAVTIAENTRGVIDFLSFTVSFDNGAIGSAEVLNCVPPGYPAFHQMELYGTEGAIRARDHELIGLTRYAAGGADFPGTYDMLLHNKPAYVRELTELIEAIEQDRPVRMPPSEARAALELTLAAVESARIGRPVRLGEGAAP